MKCKRLVSFVVVLVAVFALSAASAYAQIVAPPVDNTDIVSPPPTPPAPGPQVAPTLPPAAKPAAPAPKVQIQAPAPIQPVATKPSTRNYYGVILLLLAIAAVAIGVYMFFRQRRARTTDEPESVTRPTTDPVAVVVPEPATPPTTEPATPSEVAVNVAVVVDNPAPEPAPASIPGPGPTIITLFILALGLATSAFAQTGKISKISPEGFYQGLANQTVTITGTDLANVSAVSFGNPTITATVGATTATSVTIKASVPATTQVGRYSIKILNNDGSTVDTTSVVLYVFSRDSALVGSYVEGRLTARVDELEKKLDNTNRIEGLKKTLAADTAKIQTEVNTRLDRQDARLGTFATKTELNSFTEGVKARLAEISAAKNELGANIGSLNARITANEAAVNSTAALANEAADDAELAMGLVSETADKTVVVEASAIPFKRAKKETLSEGSAFALAVKARLAEIAAAKGKQ